MTPTTNTTNNHHECSNEQWQQPKIITRVTLCRGRQRRLGGQRSKEGWRPTSCTTRRCFENSWLVQILNILANKFRIWTRRTQHHVQRGSVQKYRNSDTLGPVAVAVAALCFVIINSFIYFRQQHQILSKSLTGQSSRWKEWSTRQTRAGGHLPKEGNSPDMIYHCFWHDKNTEQEWG